MMQTSRNPNRLHYNNRPSFYEGMKLGIIEATVEQGSYQDLRILVKYLRNDNNPRVRAAAAKAINDLTTRLREENTVETENKPSY